ncbi:TlpA disulfide reductase family protein [Conexibacter sp. DBS9H8]|uniref:TlpA family protein disulfide reductase n=1 Tax=Conexibacter sp. DBS9H8 TaxID=2937801 RepID=UPI00200E0F5D|nr:TlpA disulfide reductase family protein [Conexibacter sp. DBS9H8]
MRRYAVPAVITAVAVALLIVLATGIASQGTNNSIADGVATHHYRTAPDLHAQLPALAGDPADGGRRTRSLADYRGRVVLINLFASWCVPCQAEAPVLRQAQALLSAHGGTVLGVTYQDSPQNALSFIRRYHIDYPVVRDVAGAFANAYNVNGVPDTFVMNRAGKIVALNLYQLTPAWVHQTLPRIIAEQS